VADSKYMTPAEFAALSSAAHHAVWRADAQGRIDSAPASATQPSAMRVYNRAQVLALLSETAATR
jgi:hypothetical protein